MNLISNDHDTNSSDQSTIDSTVMPDVQLPDANSYEEPASAPTEIIYDSTSMMMGE
jgi:hypothetical protein